MLTVIIMILLSITVGVAIKHWELLSEVGEEGEEVGEIPGDIAKSDYAIHLSVITVARENVNLTF